MITKSVYLFGRGEGGAVGAVFGGGGTAGHLVGVGQGSSLHFSQHALLVERGLEEACIAVELHQIEDLSRI